MEPTPQFLILTEHEKILDVDNKKLEPNPFYKKDLEYVLRNLDRAMEIYKILFDQFLSVWYFTYQNGWIPEDERLLSVRRAVFVDHFKIFADEFGSMVQGIGDSC